MLHVSPQQKIDDGLSNLMIGNKNRELKNILDIHALKYGAPSHHDAYRPPKKKHLEPSPKRGAQKKNYNILDIEGESKPLINKARRKHSIHD